MQKLNVAILGCGRVSKFHAESYLKIPEVNLIGGIEIDPDKSKEFSSLYNLPVVSSLDKLTKKYHIDLISICTPHDLHFRQAKEAMLKNIHTIIEKPICLNVDEASELILLKNTRRLISSVCFQNRFNDTIVFLDSLIKNNLLGKILMGSICVRWYRGQSYYDDTWHGKKLRSGGGVLMTQAIHHLDLLRRYLGFPEDSQGYATNLINKSEVEDTILTTLKFKNNVLGMIEATNSSFPSHLEASLTLITQKGTIKVGGQSLNRIEYSNIKGLDLPTNINMDCHNLYGESHIKLIKNVVECIFLENTEPEVRLEDGYETLKLVDFIYRKVHFDK